MPSSALLEMPSATGLQEYESALTHDLHIGHTPFLGSLLSWTAG